MFMAGEADKRQRKAPTQMLEELQLEHPGVIALPGFSEISTFVGSLISRAKKGKTGMPQERLPPISMEVQTEIYNLDVKWATTKHLVGGKKYTKSDLYTFVESRHTNNVNGVLVVETDFPSRGRVDTLITNQRKLRKQEFDSGATANGPNLRRKLWFIFWLLLLAYCTQY